jgi:hypothetical protein
MNRWTKFWLIFALFVGTLAFGAGAIFGAIVYSIVNWSKR